jgi:hypothetical protein
VVGIKTRLGLDDGSVTAEIKANFLGGAKRERFWPSAKVLKFGRQLIYGTAEYVDANGRLVADHTVTYSRLVEEHIHRSVPPLLTQMDWADHCNVGRRGCLGARAPVGWAPISASTSRLKDRAALDEARRLKVIRPRKGTKNRFTQRR